MLADQMTHLRDEWENVSYQMSSESQFARARIDGLSLSLLEYAHIFQFHYAPSCFHFEGRRRRRVKSISHMIMKLKPVDVYRSYSEH